MGKVGFACVLREMGFSAILRGIAHILSFILRVLRRHWQIVFFSAFIFGFTIVLGAVFFLRAQMHMGEELRHSLLTTVSVASQGFDAGTIEAITGRPAMETPEFRGLVRGLNRLREAAPGIHYAYVLRRSAVPGMLEFVADADALSSEDALDRNRNGVVDPDEEASYPGDLYDPSDAPAMMSAFDAPAVDAEIITDQWGATISGYAPILDRFGKTVAILGIDMSADDYIRLSHSVFSPLAFFAFCLTSLLFLVYILVFLWQRRVEAYEGVQQERAGMMLLTYHQLGTPLTISSWSLETLEEALQNKAPLEPAVRDHIRDMRISLAQFRGILDTLKQASLIEEGKIVYKPELSALRDLCEDVLAELSSAFAHKEQRVIVNVDSALLLPLDRLLIGGVLRELLQNAMDYSPPRTVIEIGAEKKGATVSVNVTDHGYGIDYEDRSRIFNKYVRGKDAALYKPDGNGMGLFVARGIIERAGGRMRLESVKGAGTTVSFTLPIALPNS